MRKFIDNLTLYTSLPREMQGAIVNHLRDLDDATKALDVFDDQVRIHVARFTSNA